jgi:copper chaperone CopZ
MRICIRTVAAVAAMVTMSAAVSAGPVTIEGTHLCCGACAKAATEALTGVEGVTNVAVDKDAGTVKYDAADVKAARAGIRALAKAGFAGAAKHDGKDLPFPKGLMEEVKADSITVNGIHNCCPGCAKAIEGALKGVSGVQAVKCEKKSCTVTGTGISATALIEALHAEGLHGSVGGGAKKKAAPKS